MFAQSSNSPSIVIATWSACALVSGTASIALDMNNEMSAVRNIKGIY